MCRSEHICVYMLSLLINLCIYVSMCPCIYVYMYICIYVCMYICKRVYVYMCIFIFTHVHVCVLFARVENVVLSAKMLSMALLSQHKYLIERIYIFCCTHLTTCCCLCVCTCFHAVSLVWGPAHLNPWTQNFTGLPTNIASCCDGSQMRRLRGTLGPPLPTLLAEQEDMQRERRWMLGKRSRQELAQRTISVVTKNDNI